MRRLLPWLGVANLLLWTTKPPFWGPDALAYWFTGWSLAHGQPIYHATPTTGGLGYFFYAPPFAQLIAPTTVLPFFPWILGWTALELLALRWIAGSNWLAAVLLLIPVVPFELQLGNVHLFLAMALALGLTRWSGWLAALPLTKLVPVSLLYRPAVAPLVVAGAVAIASYALAPALWGQWWELITRLEPGVGQNTIPVPWIPRLLAALLLALWARRLSEGPAIVAVTVATWLTIPTMWVNSTTILLAPLAVPASRAWLHDRVARVIGGVSSAAETSLRPAGAEAVDGAPQA